MIDSIIRVITLILYVGSITILPLVLMHYVGLGFLLLYPLWIVGSYMYINHSCKKREPINFMEHTDAIGWMFIFFMPGMLSLIVFFIVYLVKY
jgi:hypothetical protein